MLLVNQSLCVVYLQLFIQIKLKVEVQLIIASYLVLIHIRVTLMKIFLHVSVVSQVSVLNFCFNCLDNELCR